MTRMLFSFVTMAVLSSASAQAQNMPLPVLLQRGTALEQKGPLALFHKGEIRALQTELAAANKAVLSEYRGNKQAGRDQTFCPVKGQAYQLGARQVLAELRSIPPAQARRMTTTDGMRALLQERFPCSSSRK